MSGNNRFIRIAQQPPAIVNRGDLFNFIAYFPKSSTYECQEDVKGANSPAGPADFPTYRSGGFATTCVIPADGKVIPLSSSSSEKWNDAMVVGTRRADFNRTNENDRTIRFELGIKGTGTFIVVVRLHRQHMRTSGVSGNGNETWTNSIITSVVTRKIQVVERVERQEENDTRSSHARYGRLTPPPMDTVEEEEEDYKRSDVDGRKLLPTDTSFNGRRDLPRRSFSIMTRPNNAKLPETEASGSNKRKGKEYQPDLHISTSTPYEQQNARRDDSEPGKDSWSNDGDSVGANLLSHGRLIMPRPNPTLLERKNNDGDYWSDDENNDDEGGVKLF